jgi:CubicO group peptidase (beta-lactamase class C family)
MNKWKISPVWIIFNLLLCSIFLLFLSCSKEQFITPEDGYKWPEKVRDYWPTEQWKEALPEAHDMDPEKLEIAHEFAQNDNLARALLVVKDGYLVFEKYYGDGGQEKSTNLWSCTKSVTSALVGFMMDDDLIESPEQKMSTLMPDYPEFGKITLHHVLTMTTGLSWAEEGPLWVQWILSDDWVAHALARGQTHDPGERFYYSSGNSHFLNALFYHRTGQFPGEVAKERLFDPLGIPFEIHDRDIKYTNWNQYKAPLYQSWRIDPMGIETASFGLYLRARDMAKFGYLYLNKGHWDGQTILSEEWVELSTKDHVTEVYGRYSYGYQWYLTFINGEPSFLASGFGGQIIGVIPSQDLVVVIKYEAENPVDPVSGTAHDDMYLFELVAEAASNNNN